MAPQNKKTCSPCPPCPMNQKMEEKSSKSTKKSEPIKLEKNKMKSCKPGVYTRNPFFNFLREFRKMHCGMKATEVVRQGAIEWNKLEPERKITYYKRSRNVPIKNRYCRV